LKLIFAPHTLHRVGTRPRCWLPPRRKETYYVRWRRCTVRLTWVPFQGIAAVAWWRPTPVWLSSDPPASQWTRMPMKRRTAKAGDDAGANLVEMSSKVLHGHLSLVEHCACRRYDDGEPRNPGWIMIGTSGASWTVTVKEPDAATSFRVVAPTLDQALDTAALLLACEEAPWEHDRFLAAQGTKKKK